MKMIVPNGVRVIAGNFMQALREVFSLPSRRRPSQRSRTKGRMELRPEMQSERKPERIPELKSELKPDMRTDIRPEKRAIPTSVISEATLIQGNLVANSNLVVAGEVQGDVECTHGVVASGRIFGGIQCMQAQLTGVYVEGNILVAGSVDIQPGSIVFGDVTARAGRIAGKVKGNVKVEESLEIAKEAFIAGEIVANMLSVEKGAIIQGRVKVRSGDAEFDAIVHPKRDRDMVLGASRESVG